MLARRFARFGWRLAHYQPHASTFRVTSALRQQSTASDSKTDGIIGRLATEKAESDLLSQQEHAQLNENIREVAKIFKNIQNREQLLDQAALQNAVTTITTRISSIKNISQLLRLLGSLPTGHVKHREMFAPIAGKIRSFVSIMDSGQVLSVLNCLRTIYWREEDLLIQLAEHLIRQRQELVPRKIAFLATSMRDLSFTHPRLVRYLIGNFVKQADNTDDWSFLSNIAFAFSKLKINSPVFWSAVCNWMNKNIGTANENIVCVRKIVLSCSVINVPESLIEKPIKLVVDVLQSNPNVRTSAGDYLNMAYGLAVLKALPNYEANKILQPEFFHEIQTYYQEKFSTGESAKMMTMRSAIRILQIGAYCRYDLSLKPKLPGNLLRFIKDNKDVFEKLRHGIKNKDVLAEFRQSLYMYAPLKSHSVAPHLHVPTGTFLDALVWVCPKRKVILPLKESKKPVDVQEVGVIFASESFLTTMDAGTEGDTGLPLTRPIGDLKMSIRHLQAANIRPVIIDYFAYTALSDNAKKIKYIKESILQPSENLEKDWH